jgi:hypothetical protein
MTLSWICKIVSVFCHGKEVILAPGSKFKTFTLSTYEVLGVKLVVFNVVVAMWVAISFFFFVVLI